MLRALVLAFGLLALASGKVRMAYMVVQSHKYHRSGVGAFYAP